MILEQEHSTHVLRGEEDQSGHRRHALCLHFREVLVASGHDAVHVGYGSPCQQTDTLAVWELCHYCSWQQGLSWYLNRQGKSEREGQCPDRFCWLPYCQGFPLAPWSWECTHYQKPSWQLGWSWFTNSSAHPTWQKDKRCSRSGCEEIVSYSLPASTFCSVYLLSNDESVFWVRKKKRLMEPTKGNTAIAWKYSSMNSPPVIESLRTRSLSK